MSKPQFVNLVQVLYKSICIFAGSLSCIPLTAAPRFIPSTPLPSSVYRINGPALCATAKESLAYLNKGQQYDPKVIHDGKIFSIPLARVKATLRFICEHQHQLNDPRFVKQHFSFYRWYPDKQQTQVLGKNKPLIATLPDDKILMTKYYVHQARVSTQVHAPYSYALYALPKDESSLTLEEADKNPHLTRFQYGKQAILHGALTSKDVPVLAYLKRDDLEAALMQGTLVAEFEDHRQTFNVHRCNNIAYDKVKPPYQQERYWYFKPVDGIKGYGKDAEHKITVNTEVTFAADLEQFGLGKLLMVQYPDGKGNQITRAGVLADTGGAFQNNQYQIDFLSGTFAGRKAFSKATQHLPDYVTAYFMVLKQ